MTRTRLEAFSDGVLAIVITIMVLELKTPDGTTLAALRSSLPVLSSYVLSYVYVGIYWNNHHHMLHTVERVGGGILWANLHLLFWLSLLPAATAWMSANPNAAVPTACYGAVLLCAAVAYWVLQRSIIAAQGERSLLARALGRDLKGKASPLLYVLGIGCALCSARLGQLVYVAVALLWLVPDRRIQSALEGGAVR